jgi:hypothetical protein
MEALPRSFLYETFVDSVLSGREADPSEDVGCVLSVVCPR